ncbi:uncharacterized protein BP5553_08096 [Venustampulla echinocandica]|uniref:Uncharacterized protein n=1 Tax=Venustampulla echinocandica TaxID=2656787 RepID=A0A370TFQ1_9HELO|nr:uncharacterized protein BP5553_08096 [Venustampulla echinocandica]RDL33728.1 hypothetical protein BP5553_08096 [Venustampulla echinocandica]
MIRAASFLVAASLFVRLVVAQAAGWTDGQVNTTMCQWDSPRAAVIRDTLYIDGGYLWWQPGMADGSLGSPIADGNPLGLVYLLNFSTPFNTSQNLTSIFTTISKAAGGGNSNNIGPQYYDGGMFANDYEWFTYGGLLATTDAFRSPGKDVVTAYEAYSSDPSRQFASGYTIKYLPDGLTRYVSNGAAVSVPSENLGFYFGGLRAASSGPIYYQPPNSNASIRADTQSLNMVELDMSVQQKEAWTNRTLPPEVPGRAGAELVWVPISERGVLVAIGGVIFPSYANSSQKVNASATAESKKQSPTFMSTVAVYDVAKGVWYEQATTGSPPGQLTQGCTVLASAQDYSSHNIYWYGGFDGLNPKGDFSDDVWVLSIPSFVWMKVKSGTAAHGRAGHRCTKPYPDQMIVVGGYTSSPGLSLNCLDGGFIQIFNLSSAEWMTSYDPSKWSNYTVPSVIYKTIGGSETGHATETSPSPTGFTNNSMKALFDSKYNTSKITTWYPYHASPTSNNNRTTLLPEAVSKSSTPSYLAPVLGVVLGLIFLSLVVLGVLLWRRRKLLKLNGTATQSEPGTMDNRRWVTNWLRATPTYAKAPTVTTDETPMTPRTEEYEVPYVPDVPEMAGVPVLEMEDTSRPTELHGTGFVPMATGKAAASGRHPNGLAHSPSTGSHVSQTSSVSRNSNGSGRPGISPVATPRADSPSLGQVGTRSRIASDLSDFSETDRGHLRGISETSVSTDGAYAAPPQLPESAAPAPTEPPTVTVTSEEDPTPAPLSVVSPLTPPQVTHESGDYIGAGATGSAGRAPQTTQTTHQIQNQNRKSNFSEKLDDSDGPGN